MKKSRVLFIPQSGQNMAGSRTRVFQYLPFFKNEKIDFKVMIWSAGGILNRLKILFFCLFYETIFIQKFLLKPWALGFLAFLDKNIIFDFDDAIYVNETTSGNESHSWNLDIDRLHKQVEKSALIVIESKYNEEYLLKNTKQKNILRIIGPIDTDLYLPRHSKSHAGFVTIGWIGSPSTTQYLINKNVAFNILKEKYGQRVGFQCIGADDDEIKDSVFDGNNQKWDLKTEVSGIQEFDIGIMPLPDDPWTRGKGGYKLLQYMAVGIPSICSPVGTNNEIIHEGENGFFADSDQEWIDKLCLLIDNEELRLIMGRKSREIAEKNYSFHHYAPILIAAVRNIAAI